jgi:folate-dependent phosphoribosylglycinamide formyltransferase PurN
MQIDVGVGLRSRDLLGAEHAIAEDLGECRALERAAHAHEPAVRYHRGRQADLHQRVAHAGDRRERLRETGLDVVLDGFDEVLRHPDPEPRFEPREKA